MKILLVDGSLSERVAVSSCLKKLGHDIVCGENGREAVELYTIEKPDLVMMEGGLPVMNSYDAARRIRSSEYNDWVPIIFLGAGPGDITAGKVAGGGPASLAPATGRVWVGGRHRRAMAAVTVGPTHRRATIVDEPRK